MEEAKKMNMEFEVFGDRVGSVFKVELVGLISQTSWNAADTTADHDDDDDKKSLGSTAGDQVMKLRAGATTALAKCIDDQETNFGTLYDTNYFANNIIADL